MFKRTTFRRFLLLAVAMLLVAAHAVTAQAQPAPTAWPMLGQNPQRTGESLFDGPLTNSLKWVTAGGSHSVAIGQEAIYTTASGLTAINFDGSLKWRLNMALGESSLAVDENEVIYIGAYYGPFYAIDANQPGAYVDGRKNLIGGTKWVYPSAGGIQASAVIDDQGSIYVDFDGALNKLSPQGSLVWSFPVGAGECNPAIGPDGTVYIGDDGKKTLYALRPDGTMKWQARLKGSPNDPAVGNPDVGGAVYTMTNDNAWTLYALNPVNGKTLWSKSLKVSNASELPLRRTVVDNARRTVYCSGKTGILYAFGFNGTLKWTLSGVGAFLNKPAIGADGIVYASSSSRDTLVAVSPSGSVIWSRYVGTPGVSGYEPAIDFDGTLYVGSNDGVFAIQDGAIPRPSVYFVYASLNPAAMGEPLDLKAMYVKPWDTTVPVVQVDFFLDMDSDGQLTELDEWLGVDDVPPETGSNWVLTMPDGFAEGTYTIFAQAMDVDGTLSNVVSTELVVEPAVP